MSDCESNDVAKRSREVLLVGLGARYLARLLWHLGLFYSWCASAMKCVFMGLDVYLES